MQRRVSEFSREAIRNAAGCIRQIVSENQPITEDDLKSMLTSQGIPLNLYLVALDCATGYQYFEGTTANVRRNGSVEMQHKLSLHGRQRVYVIRKLPENLQPEFMSTPLNLGARLNRRTGRFHLD